MTFSLVMLVYFPLLLFQPLQSLNVKSVDRLSVSVNLKMKLSFFGDILKLFTCQTQVYPFTDNVKDQGGNYAHPVNAVLWPFIYCKELHGRCAQVYTMGVELLRNAVPPKIDQNARPLFSGPAENSLEYENAFL